MQIDRHQHIAVPEDNHTPQPGNQGRKRWNTIHAHQTHTARRADGTSTFHVSHAFGTAPSIRRTAHVAWSNMVQCRIRPSHARSREAISRCRHAGTRRPAVAVGIVLLHRGHGDASPGPPANRKDALVVDRAHGELGAGRGQRRTPGPTPHVRRGIVPEHSCFCLPFRVKATHNVDAPTQQSSSAATTRRRHRGAALPHATDRVIPLHNGGGRIIAAREIGRAHV